jgi:molybdopterin molybdotransferase
LLSVAEAQEKLLGNIEALEAEDKPILECLGQVLAADVFSPINIPPMVNSAMDGYAVRSADTKSASQQTPRVLRVIGVVGAGTVSQSEVTPGTAVRIMTGAPLPKGADSVARFEYTDDPSRGKPSGEIGILAEIAPGADIRKAGEDVAAGSLVLRRGTVVRPAEVGMLASLGCASVRVHRRPVIAVLATGDELADITSNLPPGKINNSNSYSIGALVRRYGGIPLLLGISPDRENAMRALLHDGFEADMVITSGGVSMGDYDVVRTVLATEGEIIFWQVRARPGKPVVFGMLRRTGKAGKAERLPFLGVAGNPVSAMVNFELFARPALLKMLGRRNLDKPTVQAVLNEDIENPDGRRFFARAVVEKRDGRYFARLTGPQGSGILTSMALANGLVVVPEDINHVRRGEVVTVMMLDWNEGN